MRHEVSSKKLIILYTGGRSTIARKELLIDLAKKLKKYDAQYSDSRKLSSAGGVTIGNVTIILKPNKKGGELILKPNIFGTKNRLVDNKIPFRSYYSTLINSINETEKLDAIQREVLLALVEDAMNSTAKTKSQIKSVMKYVNSVININTINNDFGEVLGPLAIVSRGLLPINPSNAVVFIPGRSNEPLLDYKMTDDKKEYKISAKSGENTNTLKPGDVVTLIESSKHYKKKWENTTEFQILKILTDNTWKQGPINAALWLKRKGVKGYFDGITSDVFTEENRQQSENALVKYSREAIDFGQIFKDATDAKVYYVKFQLDISGTTKWELVKKTNQKKNDKIASKRVVFRTKNYVGRHNGDKLGFQI